MKGTGIAFALGVLIILAAACSSGIQYSRTEEAVSSKRVVESKATVSDIDYEKQTAVLKDANGQMQFVNFGPDAQNFDQVKIGDTVIAQHIESMEIFVKESDVEPSVDTFETVQRDPLTRGAQKISVSESTARIEEIDYDTRMLTLSGSNGRQVTMQAGPEVKRFNELKKGDIIVMQITKQTILRVETPE
jgi:hypothetical protein